MAIFETHGRITVEKFLFSSIRINTNDTVVIGIAVILTNILACCGL